MAEKPCTLLVRIDKRYPIMVDDIKVALMFKDVAAKVSAMKYVIALLRNGEAFLLRDLFATVIRYVLPSENCAVQKLVLLYLEIVGKGDDVYGPVPPEANLVCGYLCNNLNHPDGYIRGITLRFLCRVREPDLLEPLVASVLANLNHEDHFVRRHALSAVSAIYRLRNGRLLIPDALDIAERALATEQDAAARRNAFLMYCTFAQQRAVAYLLANTDGLVTEWPDLLQMVAIDLIHEVCRSPNSDKGMFIKIIMSLLSTPSNSVVYKCAGALLSLSAAPTVVRAAANAYCKLLSSQSDSKVKLIVLDRLSELCISHQDVVSDLLMDVLHTIASPSANVDVKRKVLDLVLFLHTRGNVEEVVRYLKDELVKTQAGEYRQLLVQAIHACAKEYPEVARPLVPLIMDFVGDRNVASALKSVCSCVYDQPPKAVCCKGD